MCTHVCLCVPLFVSQLIVEDVTFLLSAVLPMTCLIQLTCRARLAASKASKQASKQAPRHASRTQPHTPHEHARAHSHTHPSVHAAVHRCRPLTNIHSIQQVSVQQSLALIQQFLSAQPRLNTHLPNPTRGQGQPASQPASPVESNRQVDVPTSVCERDQAWAGLVRPTNHWCPPLLSLLSLTSDESTRLDSSRTHKFTLPSPPLRAPRIAASQMVLHS